VRPLQLTGQELQSDAGGLQLLGQRRQLDAANEPLVLVHDDRDRDPGRARLSGQGDGPVELGPGGGAGGDLLGEDPADIAPSADSPTPDIRSPTASRPNPRRVRAPSLGRRP